MKRILITGMSGTGKTAIVEDLRARGFEAVDFDTDAYSKWVEVVPDGTDNEVRPGQDWVWDEERVAAALADEPSDRVGDVRFVSGCASNMGRFWGRFDQVVLLTAPEKVIVERLAARSGNAYGQTPAEVERVLRLVKTIEPLLRKRANFEIDTSRINRSACDQLLDYLGLSKASTSPTGGG